MTSVSASVFKETWDSVSESAAASGSTRIQPVLPGRSHQNIRGVVDFVAGEGDTEPDNPVRHEINPQIGVVQMRGIAAFHGLDGNQFSANIHKVPPYCNVRS